MICLSGKLEENKDKELCIDGISIGEVLCKFYGKNISVTIEVPKEETVKLFDGDGNVLDEVKI